MLDLKGNEEGKQQDETEN